MANLGKQFHGYKISEVNSLLKEKDNQILSLEEEIASLKSKLETTNQRNEFLEHQVNITEKTNEEIARLALKEAATLISKAKKNANLIISESLEYVRNLSGEMGEFKKQAVEFRTQVAKMSQDLLDTIDNSSVYNLIDEQEDKD